MQQASPSQYIQLQLSVPLILAPRLTLKLLGR